MSPSLRGTSRTLRAPRAVAEPAGQIVVSNNAASAAQTYLERFGLAGYVREMVGRPEHEPALMKPNTYMVDVALRAAQVEASAAVLVGDPSRMSRCHMRQDSG